MDSINKETTGAIKLTRADAVKLVAAELAQQCENELKRCQQEVYLARERFRQTAASIALKQDRETLSKAAELVGIQHVEKLTAKCTYHVYPESEVDAGDMAQVVFSDNSNSYETKMRLTCTVPIEGELAKLRAAWHDAIRARDRADERDGRASALTKEAREALVKAAMVDRPEGRAVVDAVKALAAAIKGDL